MKTEFVTKIFRFSLFMLSLLIFIFGVCLFLYHTWIYYVYQTSRVFYIHSFFFAAASWTEEIIPNLILGLFLIVETLLFWTKKLKNSVYFLLAIFTLIFGIVYTFVVSMNNLGNIV